MGDILKIYVLKQDRPIGWLEEETFGNVSFTYFDNIEKVSYITGLTKKINYSEDGLFLIFKNLLPENNQVNQLRAQLKLSSNIELLIHLEDIHGSYSFFIEKDFKKLPGLREPIIYQFDEIQKDVLKSDYPFPNILNYELDIAEDKLFPKDIVNSKVIGLSGFQYKFSIIKDDKNKKILVDQTKTSEYFMKPYSMFNTTFTPHKKDALYIPYLLINEHLFMTIARDVGFSIPYNAIIKDKDDYHYLIKRYDRYKGEKFDHEEFATLLGYTSDTKYDPTLIQVLDIAKEYVQKEKVEELLLFFFFSTIISHGDLHSKNVSLIHASNNINEQSKHISPYYDISSTYIYKGLKERDIGLKIKNKKVKIKKIDFLEIARKFKIDETLFCEKMEKITKYFLTNFLGYVDKLPSEITELPFYTSSYHSHKSFGAILKNYYIQRVSYIKNFIDKDWVETEENIF